MAEFVLGKNCKAYYSATAVTSTSYATPIGTATEVTNIKDLKINLTKNKTDITTRASGGWVQSAATQKDGTITFTAQWKPADAAFTAIKSAYLNDTEIAFWALDGGKAVAGSQGLGGNFVVSNFTRNEGLLDAVTVDVELSPSSYNDWYTASGSLMGVMGGGEGESLVAKSDEAKPLSPEKQKLVDDLAKVPVNVEKPVESK